MERPGISIEGTVPVVAFAVSEGAVWGAAIGLIVTQGSMTAALGLGALGAIGALAFSRWYLPRFRDGA